MSLQRPKTVSSSETTWIILFAALPLIYSGQVYDGALLPKLLVFQTAALCLFGLCFKAACARGLPRPRTPVLFALFLYLFLSAVSVTSAVNRVESTLQTAQYISLGLTPLLVFWTLSRDALFRVFGVAAWAGLPVAVIGIAQYFGWGFHGIPSNANPSATFFHRNAAAEYLIGILPLAWVGFHTARTRSAAVAHAALLAILGTYLIYTRTRGAWVGLAVAIVLAGAAAIASRRGRVPSPKAPPTRHKHTLLAAAVAAALILGALPENIRKPGNQKFDEKKADPISAVSSIFSETGHRGRLNLWVHTLAIIQASPLTGIGPGNWQYLYPAYARGDQMDVGATPARPHNDFLWIASEHGLPALLAYLAVLFLAGRIGWTLLKTGDPRTRAAALGLGALLLAHLGDGVFNFPRERIASALCFWFALGALLRLDAPPAPEAGRSADQIAVTGLGTLLLLGALAIGILRTCYDWHHLRTFAAERAGNWPVAIRESERARACGPLRFSTAIILGRGRYKTGDHAGAEAAYREALRLHPNSIHAYNNLGIVYRKTGRLDPAARAFEKALDLKPDFIEASHNLGNVYRDQGHLEDAIRIYQRLIHRGLSAPQVYYNLGTAFALKGALLEAQENFQLALGQDPGYTPARDALLLMGASPTALPPDKTDDLR